MYARPHSPFEIPHFLKDIRIIHAIPQVIKAAGKFHQKDEMSIQAQNRPQVSTQTVTLDR